MKVNIKIDKSNKCNGDESLFISFTYDSNLVNIMRQQSIRYYNPNTKEWEIPAKKLDDIKLQLKDYELNIVNCNDNQRTRILNMKQCNYIPKDYKFKIKPFKHQIEGVEYGLKYDRFLLGDEQGLGKTMQAINIACIKKQQRGYKHCLIICGVNGLKWNWKAEVEKHSNEKAFILGTRLKKDKEYIGTINDRLEDLKTIEEHFITPNIYEYAVDSYFLITNIETLRNEEIIKKLKDLCDKQIINMIVVDEIHKCFAYDTLITTNKGKLKIGDIVENKINCEILSYNHKTNEFEFKPILNHFKNKVQEELIELEILGEDNKIHKINCTRNHKVYTENRGYVEAELLTENDKILIV